MSVPSRTSRRVPKLRTGDHLTREEFDRRFDATPGLTKAERIEGIVYMPMAVSFTDHGSPHIDLAAWLAVYKASTSHVQAGDNSTVRIDEDNDPQPDAVLFIDPAAGGRVRIIDGYIVGSPDLVAGVAASSVSIDLNTKLRVYQRNRVPEYVVWRVEDEEIDWFVLRNRKFSRMPPDAEGLLKSVTFPGLWLDPAALVRRDLAAVLAALSRGLATPEHAAFVERLRTAGPLLR